MTTLLLRQEGKSRIALLGVLVASIAWFFSFGIAQAAPPALDFDGVDDYVDVGNDSSLDLGTNFEISFWVKYTTTDYLNILNRIDSGGAYDQYWYVATKFDNSGKIEVSMRDTDGNSSKVYSNIAINNNKWHKVVWRRDGDTQQVLIGGVDRTDTDTGHINPGIGNINPSENIYFGGDVVSNDWFFVGDIDEVEIKIDGATKGLWHFDEGSGNTVADSSGNGNNGTVFGASWVEGIAVFASIGVGTTPVHTPQIELLTPVVGQSFSKSLAIGYKASDKDDEIGQPEFGLKKDPVAVYYNKTDQPSYVWTLVADAQSAEGSFSWDISDLTDGEYRLRFGVSGVDSDFNQVVTGTFVIDNTPPIFSLNINPVFSQGEPIQIEIETSEILKTSPILAVAQFAHKPIEVSLNTEIEGKKYSGTYEIVREYDGPASVSVRGEDLAGNKSDIIIGGNTFAVGVSPPSPPVIELPKDRSRLTKPVIALVGSGFNARKVIAKVNGVDEYVQEVIVDGGFRIENIKLDPDFNKGRNVINVVSVDQAGSFSQPATIEVTVNSSPQLALLEPAGRRLTLRDVFKVEWDASDFNEDPLTYRVELSDDRGRTWRILAANLTGTEFAWDSTTVPDSANYLMRVVVSDGSLETTATSHRISVLNNLPTIILETTGDFFTAERSKVLKGLVRSKTDLLVKLEFSSDDGKTWAAILPEDGSWDSVFERFSFVMSTLKIGSQNIVLRGFTASGRKITNAKRLKVLFDNLAPVVRPKSLPTEPTDDNTLRFEGLATDNFSGVALIEYAIDDSVWYRAGIQSGFETISAAFAINHPEQLADGERQIKVRAIDRAGNISTVKTQNIIIDTTPPRIGSFTLQIGEQIIFPNKQGIFEILPQESLVFKLAIAGEPQKVKLSANGEHLDLRFNPESKLWKGDFSFFKEEPVTLKIEVEDGLGNKAEKDLVKLRKMAQVSEVSEPPAIFWKKFLDFFRWR